MILSHQKKESGRGTKKLFDQNKGKKRPYRCIDEFNNDTDDEDHHDENDVATSSMNNRAQALLIGRSVNNYSDMASEFGYHDVKKEPV
jgi:hypothetical protein